MQMGKNNDIAYRGLTIHIQTEDLGLGACRAMSQIFFSGQIIETRTASYAERIEGLGDAERDDFIRRFIAGMHRDCYRRLTAGSYDDRLPLPTDSQPPIAVRGEEVELPDAAEDYVSLDLTADAVEAAEASHRPSTAGWTAVASDPAESGPGGHPGAAGRAFRGWGTDPAAVDAALASALRALVGA
jgi:hypothetical protein